MDEKTSDAINWLLSSAEPGVRLLVRRDLLGEDVVAYTDEVLDGPMVRMLLSGQHQDGGFGIHPYRKWTGAHWRLVSLVELGVPTGEPRALRATNTVLDWLTGQEHRSSIVAVDGLGNGPIPLPIHTLGGQRRAQSSGHRFLHKRPDPCLVGGGQLR